MSLPERFLLSYVGFDNTGQPFVDVEVDGKISRHLIMGQELALQFGMSTRHCTGWVDFENRRQEPCSDHTTVEGKYEQCIKCRNLTGFNPAFYHAATVSKQQESINQKPHFVYLAYFGPGLIKVGISQESRGIRRILEQGAKAAIKLDTFPSALVARQYEAKIAALENVAENVTSSKKLSLLKEPLDEASAINELLATQSRAESIIGARFNGADVIKTSKYFNSENLDVHQISIIKDQSVLIGNCRSVIGGIIILDSQDRLLAYNLKTFIGYRAEPTDEDTTVSLPSEQMTLF